MIRTFQTRDPWGRAPACAAASPNVFRERRERLHAIRRVLWGQNRERVVLAAALAVAVSTGLPAHPDPVLTPGAIAETHTAVICTPGYARAHRTWHDKAGTLAKYGLPIAGQVCRDRDDAELVRLQTGFVHDWKALE
jgi:hypothetical protein